MIPVSHYLFLSLALFTVGVVGVLTRRNVIIMLMSIELILNAVNINLVAFSRLYGSGGGADVRDFHHCGCGGGSGGGLGHYFGVLPEPEDDPGRRNDLLKW